MTSSLLGFHKIGGGVNDVHADAVRVQVNCQCDVLDVMLSVADQRHRSAGGASNLYKQLSRAREVVHVERRLGIHHLHGARSHHTRTN